MLLPAVMEHVDVLQEPLVRDPDEVGLADFAIVQSYLSTAGKWRIDALDALTRLFTDGPWLPPAAAPP